jgi:hypothetical protein
MVPTNVTKNKFLYLADLRRQTTNGTEPTKKKLAGHNRIHHVQRRSTGTAEHLFTSFPSTKSLAHRAFTHTTSTTTAPTTILQTWSDAGSSSKQQQ